MTSFQVRPLVIVRGHADGLFSACPAFSPAMVTYGPTREAVLEDLAWFLEELFAELDADEVQKFVVPEEASLRHVEVLVPRDDLPRGERVRTPSLFPAIELEAANSARWVLLPTLQHVTYVPAESISKLDEIVEKEISRVAAASDLDGTTYLDLLPSLSFDLERPLVEVQRKGSKATSTSREKREAEELLEKVARKLEPLEGVQHRDLKALGALLGGTERASVALVGPTGSGKTAWLRAALAEPGARPLYATSGAELVAGQSGLGQLEARIEQILKAAELLDVGVYFESFDDMFAGRAGGYEDIASLMQRWIQRRRVRIVGELTPEAYDRLEHRNVGFFSYMYRFNVQPLSRDETLSVLRAIARTNARQGTPALEDAAAALLLDLGERYDPYRVLPGRAIALLVELVARRSAEPSTDRPPTIGTDEVLQGLSAKTGIPESLLRDERNLLVEHVERFFRQHVVGQGHAVRRLSQTLCAVKAGLQPAGKPLATLLFVGPTGVGKTELAKALARFLFGSVDRMARFDMSEYTDPFAADRLIRGTDRADGVLTRVVREQPFSVLLLDEIEKAHFSVFDLLLQVSGEGRLSDARGQVAYFHNTIIILTSNLGAHHRRSSVGFGKAADDDVAYYLDQVRTHFRPEFVNRLDAVVSFASLNREQIREVARLSVERIARRPGLEGRGVRLSVSESALDALADEGFSAEYGARGLRRFLETALVAPLSTLLSRLGKAADGALVFVRHDGELDANAVPDGFSVAPEAMEKAGRISLAAHTRRASSHAESASGLRRISAWRRRARGLCTLGPLQEARGRIKELTVQLSQEPKKGHARIAFDALAELSREHARLTELVEPVDATVRELEDVESLLIAALDEPSAPELDGEAKGAFERFQKLLVAALAELSRENEVSLAVHELDQKKILHEFLLPFLRHAKDRSWLVTLHVDRGERDATGWPPVTERRWGPPLEAEQYVARWGEAGTDRPFENVLVRVRGTAAGALLAFALGRFRYHHAEEYGELWVRWVRSRYELRDEDWKHAALAPNIDVGIGRRQALRLELWPGTRSFEPQPGRQYFEDLEPWQIFDRWHELVFEQMIARTRTGQAYLPSDE